MKEILYDNLIKLVFSIATSIIVPMIFSWIKSKCQNERIHSLLTDAESAVSASVDYIEQTFVRSMKESGKWNSDAMKVAISEATENAVNMLLASSKDMLEKNGVDVREYIVTKIEAYIQSKKVS